MSGSACRYLVFLVWSSVVLMAGLYLFTGGFLLRRQVLPDKSVCSNATPHRPHPDSCNAVPRQFAKAIVIIVDALKYEFVVYNDSLPLDRAKPYQNRLPVLRRLTRGGGGGGGGGGRLYEFLADPPTTTMQRLKGLTTGSLPTFIDVSSNFASYEINEDNIIDQLKSAGKRVVFAGDDTWMGLFPGRFHRAYPFPSFDVWDLDTVDDGVSRHLYQELERPDQWDVFIGHYLGVDHAGHKFGPNHPEMTRKLGQMNEVIGHVTSRMPEDCVLFVMGDHGMTMSGDHGGDSHDELSAALFIYSKKQMNNNNNTMQQQMHRAINQVDFVPTFSLMLGLPIPFSNLGKVIHDQVVSTAVKQIQYLRVNVDQVYKYLETYTTNAVGDARGGSSGGNGGGSPLPKSTLASIRSMTEQFRGGGGGQTNRSRSNSAAVIKSADVQTMLAMGGDLLSKAKAMCQSAFIEFNLNLIASGLTVIFLHVCLLLVLVLTPRKSFLRNIINFRFLANLFLASVFGTALGVLVSVAHGEDEAGGGSGDDVTGMAVLMASTGCSLMVFGFTLLWRLRNSLNDVYASLTVADSNTVLHYSLSLFLCFALLSNSFVVQEASVHTFAVATVFFLTILNKGHNKGRKVSAAAVAAALTAMGLCRIGSVYFRCREEQQGWCDAQTSSDFHKAIGNLSQDASHTYKNWRFFFTIFSVALTVLLPHYWLRLCGNLNGLSVPVALAKYVPPAAGVALVFHWALQGLPQEMAAKLLPWQHNVLAQFVLLACSASIGAILLHPKLLYLVNTNAQRNTNNVYRLNDGVKTYYNMLKQEFAVNNAAVTEKRILVYGIGTGLSASFVLLATFFALLSMLILGDGLCPSVCLMMVTTAAFLFVTSWSRMSKAFADNKAAASKATGSPSSFMVLSSSSSSGIAANRLCHVPWSTIIGWHLMEELYFYATGHQPTFPSIQWSAAFVGGLGGAEYGSSSGSSDSPLALISGYLVPIVLVGWNTFVSRLWFGLLLPLLLLAPFAIWMVLPIGGIFNQKPSKNGGEENGGGDSSKDEELAKGEVFLLENKEETRSQLFSLCVKYCVLQCLKTFASMLAAALLRRHLMIWKIFAPRFIFEGVGFAVSLASVLVGYIVFARVQDFVCSYYVSVNLKGKED